MLKIMLLLFLSQIKEKEWIKKKSPKKSGQRLTEIYGKPEKACAHAQHRNRQAPGSNVETGFCWQFRK